MPDKLVTFVVSNELRSSVVIFVHPLNIDSKVNAELVSILVIITSPLKPEFAKVLLKFCTPDELQLESLV